MHIAEAAKTSCDLAEIMQIRRIEQRTRRGMTAEKKGRQDPCGTLKQCQHEFGRCPSCGSQVDRQSSESEIHSVALLRENELSALRAADSCYAKVHEMTRTVNKTLMVVALPLWFCGNDYSQSKMKNAMLAAFGDLLPCFCHRPMCLESISIYLRRTSQAFQAQQTTFVCVLGAARAYLVLSAFSTQKRIQVVPPMLHLVDF